MSEILLGDGDSIDAGIAAGANLILMATSRETIEAGRIGDFVDRLMSLSDRPDYVRRFPQKVALTISGYDDDPRELAQIPEVKAFFRQVAAAWPYAFHYFSIEFETLRLYVSLLVDLVPAGTQGGRVTFEMEPKALTPILHRHFQALNALHDFAAIDVAEREAISARIIAELHLSTR